MKEKKTIKKHMDQIASSMAVESRLWTLLFNNVMKDSLQKLPSFKAICDIYYAVCRETESLEEAFLKEYPEKRLAWILRLDCYEDENLMKIYDKMSKERNILKWSKEIGKDWMVDFESSEITVLCSNSTVDKIEPLLGYKPKQLFKRYKMKKGDTYENHIPELSTWTEAEAYCKREKLNPEFTLPEELIADFERGVEEYVEEKTKALEEKFDTISKDVRSFQKKTKGEKDEIRAGDTCKVHGDGETVYIVEGVSFDGKFVFLSGLGGWKKIGQLHDVKRSNRRLKIKA
jgi:hypothetical protein